MKQLYLPIYVFLIFALHSSTISAQAPAQAPAPPGPTNITKILEKAGQSTTFIRLLKTTQVADQLTQELNNTNDEITLLVPTDNAFDSLKSGSLNSINDQQKVELLQFHILPYYLSISQFQTTSNPIRTQAGSGDRFMLNVTTSGTQVNMTTGVVNASIANTIYTDNQLAVYQVDKVLLPLDLVLPPPPAPAPAKSKKKNPSLSKGDDDVSSIRTSDVKSQINQREMYMMIVLISCFAAFSLC